MAAKGRNAKSGSSEAVDGHTRDKDFLTDAEMVRLLDAAKKHGDFSGVPGKWVIDGKYEMADRNGPMRAEIVPGADGATVKDPHEVTEAMVSDFIEIRRAAGLSEELTVVETAMAPA